MSTVYDLVAAGFAAGFLAGGTRAVVVWLMRSIQGSVVVGSGGALSDLDMPVE